MKYKIIHFPSIDSTNAYLKENYEEIDDFTFVSTDYQSNGKGRNEREWFANEKENLLFSLLIKNEEIIKDGSFISLVAAVSVAQVLEQYGLSHVEIKWPNDIYVNDKKMVGILLEGRVPDYLVIGVGINVNQKIFVGEYRKEPTSMFLELNREINIDKLKEDVYDTLFNNLTHYSSQKDLLLKYFKNHDYLLNKEVNYVFDNNIHSGIAKGIDEKFNIIIESNDGEQHISSGEISLIK